MRSLATKIVLYTFGIAALIAILEHSGAFSQVLTSGSGAYATAFGALTQRGQQSRPGVGVTRGNVRIA